jgi:hypothetical protein
MTHAKQLAFVKSVMDYNVAFAARRPAARLTARYSRWSEPGLHLAASALSSGSICERKGSETFFVVARMAAI